MRTGPNTAWLVENDRVVVMIMGTGQPEVLDALGSAIWLALYDGASLPDVVDDLVAAYDAPADEVRHGVTALIESLLTKGYLVEQDPV